MDVLEYKGYVTKVHYDVTTKKLYGKVQGIVDAVNYESDTIDGVEAAFHDSVDRYLAFCAAVKRRPCKAFKGQFHCPHSHAQSHGCVGNGTRHHLKCRHGRSCAHLPDRE